MTNHDQHADETLRDFLAAEHLRLSKPEHPEPRQNPMLNNYLGGIQAALDHLRTLRLNGTAPGACGLGICALGHGHAGRCRV